MSADESESSSTLPLVLEHQDTSSKSISYIETPNGFYSCDISDDKNIIGIGSFANIYKGFYIQKQTIVSKNDTDSPIVVAIKYLNDHHIEMEMMDHDSVSNSHIHSFLNDEVKIMKLLQGSSFVLNMLDYDFNKPNNQRCIVLEMASCTLYDILYNDNFSKHFHKNHSSHIPLLILYLNWFVDCFEGLQYIHSLNIIHHDIKPDNIFYFASSSGYGHMKIADFGLAHIYDSHKLCTSLKAQVDAKVINHNNNTTTQVKCKSPKHGHNKNEIDNHKNADPAFICKGLAVYQPPELFFFPPKCTFAADVYGMIIVLNEVLTGRKPADDDCHSPRTLALKNVLHTAGSLPLQICGGLRPFLYDGETVQLKQHICVPTLNTNQIEKESLQNNVDKTNLVSSAVPALSLPVEIIQRIQHLIRAGWSTKPNDRPHDKGVITSIKNILKLLQEESMEENHINHLIDSDILEITKNIAEQVKIH